MRVCQMVSSILVSSILLCTSRPPPLSLPTTSFCCSFLIFLSFSFPPSRSLPPYSAAFCLLLSPLMSSASSFLPHPPPCGHFNPPCSSFTFFALTFASLPPLLAFSFISSSSNTSPLFHQLLLYLFLMMSSFSGRGCCS